MKEEDTHLEVKARKFEQRMNEMLTLARFIECKFDALSDV